MSHRNWFCSSGVFCFHKQFLSLALTSNCDLTKLVLSLDSLVISCAHFNDYFLNFNYLCLVE